MPVFEQSTIQQIPTSLLDLIPINRVIYELEGILSKRFISQLNTPLNAPNDGLTYVSGSSPQFAWTNSPPLTRFTSFEGAWYKSEINNGETVYNISLGQDSTLNGVVLERHNTKGHQDLALFSGSTILKPSESMTITSSTISTVLSILDNYEYLYMSVFNTTSNTIPLDYLGASIVNLPANSLSTILLNSSSLILL
jgi:hypothetical protein